MGMAAQTTVLVDGVAGVSAGQLATTAGIGAGLSATINFATDPNASPNSLMINGFAGAYGGTTKLGLNAAAGLANQWVPTTVNNAITYGASWSLSQIISHPNSALSQSVSPYAGTSWWSSPVMPCGPYPRQPC